MAICGNSVRGDRPTQREKENLAFLQQSRNFDEENIETLLILSCLERIGVSLKVENYAVPNG